MPKTSKASSSWTENPYDFEFDEAAEGVSTPETRKTPNGHANRKRPGKNYGLGANGKGVSGSARQPGFPMGGSIGARDARGNLMQKKPRGSMGQSVSSGTVYSGSHNVHQGGATPGRLQTYQELPLTSVQSARSRGPTKLDRGPGTGVQGGNGVLKGGLMAPGHGHQKNVFTAPKKKGGARIVVGDSLTGFAGKKKAISDAREKRREQEQQKKSRAGGADRWRHEDEGHEREAKQAENRRASHPQRQATAPRTTYGTIPRKTSSQATISTPSGGISAQASLAEKKAAAQASTQANLAAYNSGLVRTGKRRLNKSISATHATVQGGAGADPDTLDFESPTKRPKRNKSGGRKKSPSEDVVTIEDSSSDEEEGEDENEDEGEGVEETSGRNDGEMRLQKEDERGKADDDARRVASGMETGDGFYEGQENGELSQGQGAVSGKGPIPKKGQGESMTGISPDQEKAKQQRLTTLFAGVPTLEAEAVMVGTWVVIGRCEIKILQTGEIKIHLQMAGEVKDTTLRIPPAEVTFFGFSAGDGKQKKALIVIRTPPSGSIAQDLSYRRKYDPVDKGAAGFITAVLPSSEAFRQQEKSIIQFISPASASDDGVGIDVNMKGELPRILRRELSKSQQTEEAGDQEQGTRMRTRRTLRSGALKEEASQVLFHYPPEPSSTDRVAIHSLDEARTQEGEFLNDSLVDLYLKHMHREAFRTWEGAMDDGKVHVFTSHFFTKLTETRLSNFDAAYSKVQHWTRSVDLFTKKFVLVPVVENMHWSLACLVNLDKLEAGKRVEDFGTEEPRPCMLFLDSLDMHHANRIHEYLRRYLSKKWDQSDKGELTIDKEMLPLVRPKVPTQINGCDCGVYVLRYAKEICRQWPAVSSAQVEDSLAHYFRPSLFTPQDIVNERRRLQELLRECKVRYEAQKPQQKRAKGKGKSKAEGKKTDETPAPPPPPPPPPPAAAAEAAQVETGQASSVDARTASPSEDVAPTASGDADSAKAEACSVDAGVPDRKLPVTGSSSVSECSPDVRAGVSSNVPDGDGTAASSTFASVTPAVSGDAASSDAAAAAAAASGKADTAAPAGTSPAVADAADVDTAVSSAASKTITTSTAESSDVAGRKDISDDECASETEIGTQEEAGTEKEDSDAGEKGETESTRSHTDAAIESTAKDEDRAAHVRETTRMHVADMRGEDVSEGGTREGSGAAAAAAAAATAAATFAAAAAAVNALGTTPPTTSGGKSEGINTTTSSAVTSADAHSVLAAAGMSSQRRVTPTPRAKKAMTKEEREALRWGAVGKKEKGNELEGDKARRSMDSESSGKENGDARGGERPMQACLAAAAAASAIDANHGEKETAAIPEKPAAIKAEASDMSKRSREESATTPTKKRQRQRQREVTDGPDAPPPPPPQSAGWRLSSQGSITADSSVSGRLSSFSSGTVDDGDVNPSRGNFVGDVDGTNRGDSAESGDTKSVDDSTYNAPRRLDADRGGREDWDKRQESMNTRTQQTEEEAEDDIALAIRKFSTKSRGKRVRQCGQPDESIVNGNLGSSRDGNEGGGGDNVSDGREGGCLNAAEGAQQTEVEAKAVGPELSRRAPATVGSPSRPKSRERDNVKGKRSKEEGGDKDNGDDDGDAVDDFIVDETEVVAPASKAVRLGDVSFFVDQTNQKDSVGATLGNGSMKSGGHEGEDSHKAITREDLEQCDKAEQGSRDGGGSRGEEGVRSIADASAGKRRSGRRSGKTSATTSATDSAAVHGDETDGGHDVAAAAALPPSRGETRYRRDRSLEIVEVVESPSSEMVLDADVSPRKTSSPSASLSPRRGTRNRVKLSESRRRKIDNEIGTMEEVVEHDSKAGVLSGGTGADDDVSRNTRTRGRGKPAYGGTGAPAVGGLEESVGRRGNSSGSRRGRTKRSSAKKNNRVVVDLSSDDDDDGDSDVSHDR